MSDANKPDSKRDEPRSVTLASLRKSEERLALAIEGSRVGLWDWRVQTGEVEFNGRWAQIVGYELQELAPHSFDTWAKLLHPDDLEMSNRLLQKCFDAELPVLECEVRMRHKDGHWIWVLSRGKVVEWGKDGKPVRMSGTHLDITERKQAEAALRKSEQALRTIFDNTHDAIFVHAIDGQVLDVNRKMLEMYRVTREEALRSAIAEDFSTPDNPLDQLRDRWNRVLAGESVTFEWKAKRPNDGSAFDVEVALKRINLGNRNVVLANVRDISQRKEADRVLQESEQRYRSLFDHSTDAILLTKPDGTILDANPAACKMFGRSLEEMEKIGRNGLVDATDPRLSAALKKRALRGGGIAEITMLRADGEKFPVEITSTIFIDDSSQPKTSMIIRDITDRKRAEEEHAQLQAQLIQAQKLESVGRLAGGVAHDYNNMLSVILGYTELALKKVGPSEPLYADLKEILKAAQRSTEITRQLLAYARKQTIAPKVLDLNATVEGMLKMLRRLIGEDIEMVWLPTANLWPVKMDPAQIDQILANLCVNARDAIVGVGRVTIETHNATLDPAYCADHPGSVPGEFVLLTVRDDGCGMAPDILHYIFEPFFTTKDASQGTGLGLATVYGVVKQNEGFIHVDSEPGKGTTFKIYLPRHEGEAEGIRTQAVAEIPASRGEMVLLVEDELAIRRMGQLILESLGYRVIVAATPDEALRLAAEHKGGIHLLITDVVMPAMNGRDLANRLHALYPDIKTLFMSGYTASLIAHRGVLDESVQFLQKPFSIRDLAVKLREILGGAND